jgi:hypothetical protein
MSIAWNSIHVFTYKWRTFSYILLYFFLGYILGRDNLEETIQVTDVEPGSDGNSKSGESVYTPFYTFSFPYRITSMLLINNLVKII